MPSYVPPKKGVQFIFCVGFISQADTKLLQTNPTIAAGDFKVSTDDSAMTNLATLPTVAPAGSKRVKITLSAAEMNGDNITVVCSDASGAEWCDLLINIQTSARQVDDLMFPTVSGRSADVTATGAIGIDWANVENPTTALNLSGTNIDVDQVVASVSGAVGSVTGSVGSVTGAVGSVTGSVGSVAGNVGGSVASVTAGVTVTTNNDKTGYSLSAAAVQAIWDALTSALTTVGSIGKRIADFLTGDAYTRLGAPVGASISADIAGIQSDTNDIQTRLPAALTGGRMDSSVGAMAANVMTAAAAAADLTTELQAGLSTLTAAGVRTAVGLASANLDTQLGAIDDFLDTEIAAIKAKTDNLPAAPAAVGDIPTAIQNADALLDRANAIETGLTLRQAMRLLAAVLAGKLSGAATTTITIRNVGDTKDRIIATVDANGNRTAISTDVT